MDKLTAAFLTLPSPAEVDRLVAAANAARATYIANGLKRVFVRLFSAGEGDDAVGFEPKLR
jgi:hypothetical protein